VANSGSDNVLVYPGLGNGQFGPALNGGHGYFVGTNPVAIAVAELNGQPDLLVANAGSNDVSVMLGEGRGATWTLIPGPRIETQGGPDALAVGSLTGAGTPDLFVANGQANTVEEFQGIGNGFFNDQSPTVCPVGQAPAALFLGNFSGLGLGLATLNASSNDGTLITGLGSGSPQTQTFPTGGEQPTTGFAGDFTDNGFSDLVVGNTGDGRLALLLGGTSGLSLSQTLVSPEAPSPTSLSFAGLSNGVLSFYVSTAGREAAVNLAFDLSGGTGLEAGLSPVVVTPGAGLSLASVLSQATSGSVQQVTQLLSFSGTKLDLAAILLTVSVATGNNPSESSAGAVATVGSVGFGQPVGQAKGSGGPTGLGEEPSTEPGLGRAGLPAVNDRLPTWERLSIGLERAWDKARATILELESQGPAAWEKKPSARPAVKARAERPVATPAQPGTKAGDETRAKPASPAATPDQRQASDTAAIDAALEDLAAERHREDRSVHWGLEFWNELAQNEQSGTASALVAVMASASAAGTAWTLGPRWSRRRRLALNCDGGQARQEYLPDVARTRPEVSGRSGRVG